MTEPDLNFIARQRRPDRSHYVLDISPDFITTVNNKSGERRHIQVGRGG